MAVYPLFYFFRKEIYGAMGVSEGLEAPMHMAQTLGRSLLRSASLHTVVFVTQVLSLTATT